jgi:uncharacterized phage-associated protein
LYYIAESVERFGLNGPSWVIGRRTVAGPYDSRAVANAVLHYAKASGKTLTPMQLIKLVYVANGWSLALLNRPLIAEQIHAWQYGPVIPNVYRAFNRFGSAPITGPAINDQTGFEYSADFDEDDQRLMKVVVDSYGHMHAFQLSNKMHEPGTPWTKTFTTKGPYSVIPADLIKRHFLELKEKRNVRVA